MCCSLPTARSVRRIAVISLALVAGAVGGCGGGSDEKAPPGSASNPLKALPNPTPTRTPPDQVSGEGSNKTSKAPRASEDRGVPPKSARAAETAKSSGARKQKAQAPSASRPCTLVPKSRAQSILREPILQPTYAPLGPTCLYRSRSGKVFVTLGVQEVRFASATRKMTKRKRLVVGGRAAYCGTLGRPITYVRLSARRVLMVTAPCAVARKFAAHALRNL